MFVLISGILFHSFELVVFGFRYFYSAKFTSAENKYDDESKSQTIRGRKSHVVIIGNKAQGNQVIFEEFSSRSMNSFSIEFRFEPISLTRDVIQHELSFGNCF